MVVCVIVDFMKLQVGVKVIFKSPDGRVLLLERANSYQMSVGDDESWDIPGGRIKPEEDLQSALAREIREEIGVTLKNPQAKLIDARDIFVPTKDLHVVRLTYLIEQEPGHIKLSNEHSRYDWFNPHNIKLLDIDPYLKEVFEEISPSTPSSLVDWSTN